MRCKKWCIIGALLYVSTVIRPDIRACVSILGRRNEIAWEADWVTLETLIHYLKTTKHFKFITVKCKLAILTGFCDYDMACDRSDRKFTTRNLLKLGINNGALRSRTESHCPLTKQTILQHLAPPNKCSGF